MLTKNLPTNKLFPVLFIRLILDGIAGIRFLTQGKFKHFWAVLKSHFYFYLYLPKFIFKRSEIQSKNYYKIKSIVYRYFIKKAKVFKQL